MSDAGAVLEARGVRVRRGRRAVLSDVALSVPAGRAVRLSGPNGSGKTSLLRVLAGLVGPAAGTVRRRGAYAFVPERVALAPALRGGEWLAAMRRLRGLEPVDWAAAAVASGLEDGVLARPAGALSAGMRQRVALLEALRAEPALLLLDEPAAGLDADGRAWLAAELAAALARSAAVVLSDHGEADTAAPPGAERLRLLDGRCELGAPAASALLVRAAHPDGRRLERRVPEDESDALLRELLAAGWHVERLGP